MPAWLCGQLLLGAPAVPFSPGCWMPTNSVRPSGVLSTPVISHSFGPTRKRLSVAAVAAAPTRVAWVEVAPPVPVLVIVRVPPSPTVPVTR